MEFIHGVHQLDLGAVNAYLIVEDEGITLIDAGLPAHAAKILEYINRMDRKPQDLKRILITHADMDHVGGVKKLVEASGAEVYASQIEAEAMRAGRPSRVLNGRADAGDLFADVQVHGQQIDSGSYRGAGG